MQQLPTDSIPFSEVRPRFEIQTQQEMEAITAAIKTALDRERAPCKGQVNPGYITLYLPLEEQHYWSPHLTIMLEEEGEGVLLRGVYGPRPAVWTMFVFFYALIGFGIVVISIIGLSNRSLGGSGTILWLLPVLVLVVSSLYLVAYLGKQLGHDQMVTLHHFFEEATGLRLPDRVVP